MKRYGWAIALIMVVLIGLGWTGTVRAQEPLPPVHVVQEGESLWSIAQLYGLDVDTLVALNSLENPDALYVGQELRLIPRLPGLEDAQWRTHRLDLGERLTAIAHAGQLTWEQLALANQVLEPTTLPVGTVLYLPRSVVTTTLTWVQPGDTWLSVALRTGVPSWTVRSYNPRPLWSETGLLLPGEGASQYLPYPLQSLAFSAPSVVRGETTVLQVGMAVSGTCHLADYRGVQLPCQTLDPTQRVVLLGVHPMAEPGNYPITLTVSAANVTTTLVLPLLVEAGNYAFEQLEFDAEREALLASDNVKQEVALLDSLRPLSTTQRLWQYPFLEPVLNKPITSLFGTRRAYGDTNYGSFHAGVDYAAAAGTPVQAPADGIVILAQPLTVRGNAIMLDHGWGVLTGYWHLSEIKVQPGQRVTRGDVIGLVGSTGLSTGPHLHWEMWVNGVPVNARQWLTAFAPFPPFPSGEQP